MKPPRVYLDTSILSGRAVSDLDAQETAAVNELYRLHEAGKIDAWTKTGIKLVTSVVSRIEQAAAKDDVRDQLQTPEDQLSCVVAHHWPDPATDPVYAQPKRQAPVPTD